MTVSRVQDHVVLEDEGGDPHVVRGDGLALAAELAEHGSEVMGRGLVRDQDGDTGTPEEAAERALVLRSPPPDAEAGAQLAEDGEGKEDLEGVLHEIDGLFDVPASIATSLRLRPSRRAPWPVPPGDESITTCAPP